MRNRLEAKTDRFGRSAAILGQVDLITNILSGGLCLKFSALCRALPSSVYFGWIIVLIPHEIFGHAVETENNHKNTNCWHCSFAIASRENDCFFFAVAVVHSWHHFAMAPARAGWCGVINVKLLMCSRAARTCCRCSCEEGGGVKRQSEATAAWSE